MRRHTVSVSLHASSALMDPCIVCGAGVDYKKLGALLADPAANNHAANLATAAVAAAA